MANIVAPAATASFLALADDALVVRFYGKKLDDLPITPTRANSLSSAHDGAKPVAALLYGSHFLGKCFRFPKPMIAVLPDTDVDPTGCEEFLDPKKFRMWSIPKDGPTMWLDYKVQSAAELASPVHAMVDVDAKFGFQNVHFDPGKLTISGQLRAYLRLHQNFPWPIGDIGATVIDATWDFRINAAAGSATINFGVASLTLQYVPPTELCGSVTVSVDVAHIGHFGHTFPLGCIDIAAVAA